MHFNILLTLSTLTALSSNVAAQSPLSGINGLGALGGLGASSQTPGPSSTPIPTFVTKPATPSAFPSRTPRSRAFQKSHLNHLIYLSCPGGRNDPES
ncbi:uncharacterized protein N7500_006445 [Penicillium coprophilum]|uniref:uncharacterized protein n=1 Tax=Penicillium coprophilum TaxID=36646 RepID=UPI002383E686|nr:uncharacterized protein N7500_006445 [Penicillium coprophilum]KAJ5164615.1 hypothetical protein N7500_006445 [Penicillium coprophilum]